MKHLLFKIYYISFSAMMMVIIFACGDTHKQEIISNEPELTQEQLDSIALEEEFANCDSFPTIKYTTFKIKDLAQLREIQNEYRHTEANAWKHKIIITLNRKELGFFRVGGNVVIPDTIIEDTRAYSVFPQCYKGAANLPKLIVVSNAYQAYACYEYGHLVRFAAANTGKERTPTFPGRYSLVWKALERRSSLDSNWIMPYTWNFHEHAGNAFHKFVMPGYAVSHSCVRQFMSDAKWLYDWGEGAKKDSQGKTIPFSGTPVIIIDIFDFERKEGAVWHDLKTNKDIILELPPKPMDVEKALIPWVQIPDGSKGSVPDKQRYIYAEDTLRARGIIREGVRLIPTVDFNKLRREKAAREWKKKEEEERKQLEIQKQNETQIMTPNENGNKLPPLNNIQNNKPKNNIQNQIEESDPR